MKNEKLNSLMMLRAQNDITMEIDYDPVIKDFAMIKARRKLLRRAASRLVRLVEGEERWEASVLPQGVFPQNWGRNEQNHTVTCMVLKATANDWRKNAAPCHAEFRGP
ncbi:hypothetical protein TNCV_2630271 [Trichonephila clavipes]|uniref:Uncharacterized protein n=1 Tax=Trichonephila clavipes TaxID=2585209 RepID=A0A8X6SFP2_TRICX|nr:hypothetical protein TNCV_2630271 [Trichonephila clavipes]